MTLKQHVYRYKQSWTSGKVNGAVPKCLRSVMAETDSDAVHCPTLGSEHWMFDTRLADGVNEFAHVPIWRHQGSYHNEHRLYGLVK